MEDKIKGNGEKFIIPALFATGDDYAVV